MAKISLRNVSVSYQNMKESALNHFDADFEDGKISAILGVKGSGKTTIIKAIASEVGYTGTILFDDENILDRTLIERRISIITTKISLNPYISIFRNIAEPLERQGLDPEQIKEQVNYVAKALKIEHCLTRTSQYLSLRQNLRACIAREILKRPSMIVFDEPFANVDKSTRETILIELKKILNFLRITTLFATSDGNEALYVADNIFAINKGRLIASGTAAEIYDLANELVRELFNKQIKEKMKNEKD